MEMLSALLALYKGNLQTTSAFLSQKTRNLKLYSYHYCTVYIWETHNMICYKIMI